MLSRSHEALMGQPPEPGASHHPLVSHQHREGTTVPRQSALMPGAWCLHCPDTGQGGLRAPRELPLTCPSSPFPFLPPRSEPPDLQGLHNSAREPPSLTPSTCPQASQRKNHSCARPEPRTRGQQSTSLRGPLPLRCPPQLKHPNSSRVLERSSVSSLRGRTFLQSISPEIKVGKET